jgi:hypothetical protein
MLKVFRMGSPVEKAKGGKVYTFLEYLHVSMLTFVQEGWFSVEG